MPPQPPQQPRLDLSKRNAPPPPPPKKEEIPKWLGHKDEGSGETYYEETQSGRTTWTKPEGEVAELPKK